MDESDSSEDDQDTDGGTPNKKELNPNYEYEMNGEVLPEGAYGVKNPVCYPVNPKEWEGLWIF